MPSIDERVVSMSFENQVFEQRVSQTMGTLSKLDTAVRNMGSASGFDKLESQASKVTFQGPMSALERLRAKFGGIGTSAQTSMGEVERSGARLTLQSPFRAIDNLVNRFGRLNAGTTFTDIEKAADRTTLSGVLNAIDNVSSKFSVLQGAASVALGNIASQAAARGGAFVKSFAFGPIQAGLEEYQTNLKAIQTVQANTDQPLTKINKSLQELNTYSDQTIYNFGEMAKNVGTFTAAGVDLKTSVSSIKGIANLAALSGSSSQQAATAMYQLSQAISSGRVGLQDWNSVVNAGMGGKKLQNALAQTSVAMGGMKDSSVQLEGPMKKLTINGKSFRESIQSKPGDKPWLTSEVLVNTLATLDGRFSKAALSAEKTKDGLKKYTAAQIEAKIADNRAALEKKNGVKYTDDQFKALMKLSDSAFKSATEVKTLGQVFDIAKETIGSGWSASFQSIFGNLGEAKKTFTALSGTINGFINDNAMARNQVLHDWKALGGRAKLIDGITEIFKNLISWIRPIKDAFRDIFPAMTGKRLFELTELFNKFAHGLNTTDEFAEKNRRIFRGLFAVLHIGFTIVKEVAGAIFDLVGIAGKGSGGIHSFAASIGDFLVSVDNAVTKGGLIKGIFKGMVGALGGVVSLLKILGRAIGNVFSGADKATGLSSAMGQVTKSGEPLAAVADRLKSAWGAVSRIFQRVKTILDPAFKAIGDQAGKLADTLGNAFSTGNFDKTMAVLQTGLLGGILLVIRRFRSSLEISLSGGLFDKVNKTFGALTGNLKAMQENLQAKTLFAIAASLVALVGGIYILSTIDGKKLAKAMTAMAVGMGQLVGVMGLLGNMMKGPGKTGMLMMPFIAASMIELAIAATIIAVAMKIFATMSWEDLVKGLAGLGGSLLIIGAGLKFIGPMALVQGPALILVAIGLNILAAAVKQFSDMSWTDLIRGLLGMGFAFVALAAGLGFMGPTLILTGPGLVAVAIGMNMLAGAVGAFGSLKLETLGKGILAIGLSLAVLGVGLMFIGPEAIIAGPALLIVAAGMTALSGAIAILGNMKVSTLVKGIAAMGASLLVLGVGLLFMSGTLLGSVALLAAAAAMLLLGPALAMLGALKWSTILSGLAAMSVTLGVLAIAGLLVAGPIATLALALGALGIAMTLVAAPIYIFAQALALLGTSGTKGIAVMGAALVAFVTLLPKLVIDFIKGIVEIVRSIAELAPKVAVAIGVIIDTLLGIITEAAPKMAVASNALILALLTVIDTSGPRIIQSGINLMLAFMTAIENNISKVVEKAGNIIVAFLNGIAAKIPSIVAAGVRVIVAWLNGIANAAPRIVAAATNVVVNFVRGIAAQIPRVVPLGIRLMVKFLDSVASKIGTVVRAGANLIIKFIDGVGNALPRIVHSAVDVVIKFVNSIAKETPRLATAGFRALIEFLHGIAKAIRENEGDLIEAGVDIAKAIVEGLVDGLGKVGHLVRGALMNMLDGLPKFARRILGIKSPSTVFAEIGKQTMQGMAVGLSDSRPVDKSIQNAAKSAISMTKSAFGKLPNALDGVIDTNPVITPVLDLSQVKADSKQFALPNQGINVVPISAAASYQQASAISTETAANGASTSEGTDAARSGASVVHFEQNNYSPKALSEIEVYRQTNNQIGNIKRALGV